VCRAIPTATPFVDQPDDCVRLFFSQDASVVPSDWESEVEDAPISIGRAIIDMAPLLIGPPFLLMALGASVYWALAGFKRKS
jgi:hypothetical protein